MTQEIFHYGNSEIRIKKQDNLKKLYIELTNSCNMACKMCFRRNFTDCDQFMDDCTFRQLKQNIDGLSNLKYVVLGGIGEPLLHEGLRDLVTYIKSKGIHLSVQTNGLLLDDELITFFQESGLDRIVISYEPEDVGHIENKNLMETIKHIAAVKKQSRTTGIPRISIEIVLTKESIKKLPSLAEELTNIGVNEFILSNIMAVAEEYMENTLYFDCSDEDLLKPFHDVVRHKGLIKAPYFNLKTERHCDFIENNAAVVRYDGAIAPCYRFLHEGGKEFIKRRCQELEAKSFGNINNEDIVSIWNKRDYLWFRFVVSNAMYPSCTDCRFYDGCDYLRDTYSDCWGNNPSCGNCLWARRILICP